MGLFKNISSWLFNSNTCTTKSGHLNPGLISYYFIAYDKENLRYTVVHLQIEKEFGKLTALPKKYI